MLRKTLKSREFFLKIVKFGLLLHELHRSVIFKPKELFLVIQIMKKSILLVICVVFSAISLWAQPQPASVRPGGKSHQMAFGLSLPVGRFFESHAAGLGWSYNWSHRRFGDNVNARKLIGFTAQAGFDYFFGKNDTLLGHTFKNRNMIYLQVMPGVIYNPTPKTAVTLLTGPSLGIYNGVSNISFAASLNGTYSVGQKISIGPSIVLRKHEEVDAYWTVGLTARILLTNHK
jgi:hypothetical protein